MPGRFWNCYWNKSLFSGNAFRWMEHNEMCIRDRIGTIAVVKQLVKLPGKVVRVLVEGLERAELLCLEAEEPAMMGEIAAIEAEEDDLDSLTQEAMLRILKEKLEEYGRVNPKITKEILPNLLIITDLNEMLDQIAIQLPWDYTCLLYTSSIGRMVGMGMTTATIIMHQGINTGAVFGHVFDFTGMPIGLRVVFALEIGRAHV